MNFAKLVKPWLTSGRFDLFKIFVVVFYPTKQNMTYFVKKKTLFNTLGPIWPTLLYVPDHIGFLNRSTLL